MKEHKTLHEFKKFIMRGNVIDMAAGVIIGGAFSKIVTSLVNDIAMPLIGLVIGGVDFTSLAVSLPSKSADGAVLSYGMFLQNVLDFLIIAACIFFFTKLISKLHRKKEEEPEPPPPPDRTEVLLEEIRDLLKEQAKKES